MKNKILLGIAFFIFSLGLIFFSYNILLWRKDNLRNAQQINNINKIVKVIEVEDSLNTETIAPNKKITKNDLYWKLIKDNLIDINIKRLKQINPASVGWIKVNGTNINYPFVQGKDNKYYLNHSFDEKKNSAGWVFLDYRNSTKLLDKNTIIYAHARRDQTMFGSLRNILKSTWYQNPSNYVIKIATEYQNTLWQVFSVYKIKTTSDYIKVVFSDDHEFQELTNLLLKRSYFDFKTTVSSSDKIITLSTCYDKNERIVMHAKLIKITPK